MKLNRKKKIVHKTLPFTSDLQTTLNDRLRKLKDFYIGLNVYGIITKVFF